MKRLTRITVLLLAPVLALAPAVPGHAGVPPTITAQPVVTGVTWPAAFTFASGGNLFFGNRLTGGIKIFNQSTSTVHHFFKVPGVASENEQGLLGIAVDPNYPATPFVYAYATRMVNGALHNQIVRIRASHQTGVSWRVIFTVSTVAAPYHNGGRILFGPDGKLYAIVGDAHTDGNAQNLSNPAGKILRMNANGKAPGGNIWGGRIFTTGVRNSFGFTFDPATGDLWETENGPECNDEINQFSNGDNGGWGASENCGGTSPDDTNNSGSNPVFPLEWFTPTIAPTGTVFCPAAGCGLPAGTEGDLFFGTFNDSNIHEADPADVPGTDTPVVSWSSGILSMERNPVNGLLFFSDSGGIFELVASS